MLLCFFQGQNVVIVFLHQSKQLVSLCLKASRDIFDRFPIIQKKLNDFPGINKFEGKLGFYEICRATDAAQVNCLHISSVYAQSNLLFKRPRFNNLWRHWIFHRVFRKLRLEMTQK